MLSTHAIQLNNSLDTRQLLIVHLKLKRVKNNSIYKFPAHMKGKMEVLQNFIWLWKSHPEIYIILILYGKGHYPRHARKRPTFIKTVTVTSLTYGAVNLMDDHSFAFELDANINLSVTNEATKRKIRINHTTLTQLWDIPSKYHETNTSHDAIWDSHISYQTI